MVPKGDDRDDATGSNLKRESHRRSVLVVCHAGETATTRPLSYLTHREAIAPTGE